MLLCTTSFSPLRLHKINSIFLSKEIQILLIFIFFALFSSIAPPLLYIMWFVEVTEMCDSQLFFMNEKDIRKMTSFAWYLLSYEYLSPSSYSSFPPGFSTGCLAGSLINRPRSPRLKTWRTPRSSPTPTPPWTMWPRCWSPPTEGWEVWRARPAAPCLEADCRDQGWGRWAASRWEHIKRQ